MVVVSYKQKYVHKILVNCLVNLKVKHALEKNVVGELTILTLP